MVTRDGDSEAWKILEDVEAHIEVNVDVESSESPDHVSSKRPLSPTAPSEQPPAKRLRASSDICVAPLVNTVAQRVLSQGAPGTGDLFMKENFREKWCRCTQCSKDLIAHPYLLEEEETYEPPEDPDSGL